MRKQENKKPRELQMDLLRVIAMLLIVSLHSIDHSGVLENYENVSVALKWYVRFSYAITQVCVNCFVLISGYFMIQSRFRKEKLLSLWMDTVFYTLIIRLIFIVTGLREFSFGSLISCFVPFITGRYWFITIYVGLYILSPYLNIGLKAMDKRQHGMLNLILLGLFSLWNSIHPGIAGMNSGGGWGLAWFVVLYSLGAWVRLYVNKENDTKKYILLIYWVVVSAFLATAYVVTENVSLLHGIVSHWYRYDSIFASTSSLALLVFFHKTRISNSIIGKYIAIMSTATFGVYLIHAHADFSPWMWNSINLPKYMDNILFIPIQMFVIAGIFIGCVVLDYIRSLTIGKIERKVVGIIGDR